jgi:hypothetical protein
MSLMRIAPFLLAAACLLGSAVTADAEPMFLSKQYARCSTCHYSATGGGLLTPYGRSLSHQELSMTGKPMASHGEPGEDTGEQSFLWGALGKRLGPVQLGIDLRPAFLTFDVGDTTTHENFWMNADLIAAVRLGDWTVYGQAGRELDGADWQLDSREYWAGRQPERGIGFRVGRFLPAYGVRFADHTYFNRTFLGFDKYDQVLGVEISQTTDKYLTQVSFSPGYAETITSSGRRAFTATGRFQADLTPTTVLVASGLFRDETDFTPKEGAGGLALGFSPLPRLTNWTEWDAQFVEGAGGDATHYLVNETSFEAYRGIWLKLSPQIRAGGGDGSPDLFRWLVGANVFPRTHFNVDLSYYHDWVRGSDTSVNTFLAQFHIYL